MPADLTLTTSSAGPHGPHVLSSPAPRPIFSSRSRRRCRRALALALLVSAVHAALATSAGAATLRERLDRALRVPGVARSATGALAVNLGNGNTVYKLHAARSLEPASTQKVTVALAALAELGPAYTIPTQVLGVGTREGSTWKGRLVLKGFGDPTLTRADLSTLAWRIRALGIRTVAGRIAGDESYYDLRRTCPGWKPSWYKVESPPLSALVVDRARVGRRTADHPARVAARAFKAALERAGVDVTRSAIVAAAPEDAALVAAVRSPRLRLLVRRMNKTSDNFYAEMLLKHLGAAVRGTGSTASGARVVKRVLRERGVPLDGVRIADGSGLSLYDRLTARALAALLISAWSDPDVKDPFVSSLAIAGVDGTLEDRMTTGPARGRVRAKTGTTSTASSLAGYVGARYVFAILQNGRPIPWWYARRGQDRFAQILAARIA